MDNFYSINIFLKFPNVDLKIEFLPFPKGLLLLG